MGRGPLIGPELVVLALWLAATLGVRPLLLPDEGRCAGIAFEMLHGSALVPTRDGLSFFHRPPLLYRLDIGALWPLGAGRRAVRVGPALLARLLGAALFLHLRRAHVVAVARCALLLACGDATVGFVATHDRLARLARLAPQTAFAGRHALLLRVEPRRCGAR